MPKRTSDYQAWLLIQLKDPQVAADYLNAALDDSPEIFLLALRNVAEAHRIAKVAEEAGVSRESLYRTLSEDGNPRLSTLKAVLEVMGLHIAVASDKVATPVFQENAGIPPMGLRSQEPISIAETLSAEPEGLYRLFPSARHQYGARELTLAYGNC
jgi:probable addiction module antidote protein